MENGYTSFSSVTGIEFDTIFQVCFMIAIQVLGWVQIFKNFVKCHDKEFQCKRINTGKRCNQCMKWKWATISILFTAMCAFYNTPAIYLVTSNVFGWTQVTTLALVRTFNIFTMALAIVQLGHDVLMKAFPQVLGGILGKVSGVKIEYDSKSEQRSFGDAMDHKQREDHRVAREREDERRRDREDWVAGNNIDDKEKRRREAEERLKGVAVKEGPTEEPDAQ
jgi:hypothetical protein